jgi:hypothetical protein
MFVHAHDLTIHVQLSGPPGAPPLVSASSARICAAMG